MIYLRLRCLIHKWSFQLADNPTDDLEARVTVLKNDVSILHDDVGEMETVIGQLDDRFILVKGNVVGNTDDIDGNFYLKQRVLNCYQY